MVYSNSFIYTSDVYGTTTILLWGEYSGKFCTLQYSQNIKFLEENPRLFSFYIKFNKRDAHINSNQTNLKIVM